MDEYKIEKNIPIVSKRYGKWAKLFRKMEHGDSILLKGKDVINFITSNRATIKRNKLKFVLCTRKSEDGIRIWKLNDDKNTTEPENDEKPYTITRSLLIERLAEMYHTNALAVANCCDEVLDRSGALLGKVRDKHTDLYGKSKE